MFRLAPVLRARKAQEDAARGAVVRSRAELRDAAALVRRRQLDLAGADAPTEGTARAMVAAMVARQSLAASLSGAHRMVADVEEQTNERVAELADAAKRHRAVEMMAERHAEAVRVHDLATDQRNVDELAVTSKQRAAARGVDAVSERRANTLRHGSAADRAAVDRADAFRADAFRADAFQADAFRADAFHAAANSDTAKRAAIDLAAAHRSIVHRSADADATTTDATSAAATSGAATSSPATSGTATSSPATSGTATSSRATGATGPSGSHA